ncbi:GDSL esterase/lipase At5g03600-like [Panicum virgatum]|uniref:GDSL esterase/lipase At5g03600-like n=1 Tax=Panicum virgatum TaxID=38727 RepID=UPI0019D5171D|nr:GDSL esterase/lipase At5g03600-like [Panicum virgatum]
MQLLHLHTQNLKDLVAKVVDEVAIVVSQLQDLGVAKVIVNNVPPFGCSPWLARASNYSSCDDDGNVSSDEHNTALRDRLGGEEGVMVLDVNSIITNLVAPKEGSALYERQFAERLRPCCEADGGDGGYCGRDGGYSLCSRPEEYFYWDVVHPTHAGWRAVMQLLQGPIKAFLGISDLEHFYLDRSIISSRE